MTQYLDSSVLKKKADGTTVLSSYVDADEEIVTSSATGTYDSPSGNFDPPSVVGASVASDGNGALTFTSS